MITDFQSIVDEWSYRVGIIDSKNYKHLYHLNQILYEHGWTQDVIEELSKKLTEDDIVKNKKSGNTYVVKTHNQDTQDLVKKDASPEDVKKVDKGEEEEESKEELVKSDHDSADGALTYTKTQYNIDKEKKGPKNVGLGTNVSRAGEAAVHKGLRMIKEKKSLEQVQEHLMEIANDKDTYLTKEWVNSTIASLKSIDQHIGFNNIEGISWDTKAGRKSIGVDGEVKTSSDMFVRTKEGKNLGISLKANGNVFLNNGGWDKQSVKLLNGLKGTMPVEEHKQLEEAMSIQTFVEDRNKQFQDVSKQLQASDITEMYKKLQSEPDKVRNKLFGGKEKENYFKALERAEQLINDGRDGSLNRFQMKAMSKLLFMYDKEKYDVLRQIDNNLSRRAFDVLNTSDEAKKGMNKHILKSMHVLDTLGLNKSLKSGGIDGFITVYGIKPDGAVLNEENLTSLFGSKFQQLLSEQLKEVRDGTKETQDLQDFMADQIEIDYESGQILIKHENEDKIPLFYLDGRSKAIGASPTMELGQTPLMALALKIGTFDTSTWTKEQRAKLKKEIEKAKKK